MFGNYNDNPPQSIPVTVVSAQLIIQGSIQTRLLRLTDVVNEADVASLVVLDATFMEVGSRRVVAGAAVVTVVAGAAVVVVVVPPQAAANRPTATTSSTSALQSKTRRDREVGIAGCTSHFLVVTRPKNHSRRRLRGC